MKGQGSGWKGESRRHSLARKGIKTASGRRGYKRNQRFESGYAKNLKMDDDVYKLRREVINIIYDAKNMINLPRIDVRITSKMKDNALGLARLEDNILWIQEDTIKLSKYDLRYTVYHEILHAVFGIPHIEGDPLMDRYHNPNLSRKELDRNFKRLAKKYGGKVASGKQKDSISPLQIKIGTKVEMEHTDDPKIARKIAIDHLKENNEYYTILLKAFPDEHPDLLKEILGAK